MHTNVKRVAIAERGGGCTVRKKKKKRGTRVQVFYYIIKAIAWTELFFPLRNWWKGWWIRPCMRVVVLSLHIWVKSGSQLLEQNWLKCIFSTNIKCSASWFFPSLMNCKHHLLCMNKLKAWALTVSPLLT